MTSKELVIATLEGRNSGRAPRQMGYLPWAAIHYEKELKAMREEFPDDIVHIGAALKTPVPTVCGDPYEIGTYVDEWGCVWTNVHRGVIGEVKRPLVTDEEWEDVSKVHIPEEMLSFDIGDANNNIKMYGGGKFVIAGVCPRPFEQLQFIRGTENLYMDLMYEPVKMFGFIEKMHDFYCRLLKKWAETDADGLIFMDDWGSQKSLLIDPKIWERIFMPMYRDYIEIAHKAGKKAFMHSDGHVLSIIPKLIDIGLDSGNFQLFCMEFDKLAQYRGEINFLGEVDRQNLLPNGSRQDIADAVRRIKDNLWKDGCCVAHCEFGAGAKPENVYTVFETWNKLTEG